MTNLVQAHGQSRGIRSLLFNPLHPSQEFGKQVERSSSLADQGLIGSALRDGILPANWRSLIWEDKC